MSCSNSLLAYSFDRQEQSEFLRDLAEVIVYTKIIEHKIRGAGKATTVKTPGLYLPSENIALSYCRYQINGYLLVLCHLSVIKHIYTYIIITIVEKDIDEHYRYDDTYPPGSTST